MTREKTLRKFFTTLTLLTIFLTPQVLFTLNDVQLRFIEQHQPTIKIQEKLNTIFLKPGILAALAKKADPYFKPNEPISPYDPEELNKFFIIKSKKVHEHKQMICHHYDLPNYILKLTVQSKDHQKTNVRNISRVAGATQMRDHCAKHNFEFIVIPKKYLYHIPGKSMDLNDGNYIVIAEKLDIMDANQSKQYLIHCTDSAISQLKTLIKKFGYRDLNFDNIRITFNDGKVAVIDTELFKGFNNKKPQKWNPKFLNKKFDGIKGIMRLNKYLNSDTPT